MDEISKADDHRWLLNVLSERDIESREPLGSLVRQYFSDRVHGTAVLWEALTEWMPEFHRRSRSDSSMDWY